VSAWPKPAIEYINALIAAGQPVSAHYLAQLQQLAAPEVDHADKSAALDLRDRLLRQAAANLPGKTSAKARMLLEKLERYRATAWQRERCGEPTERHRAYWEILQAWEFIPGISRLRRILAVGRGDSQIEGA
jgi:hypothetical protein